MSGTLGTRLVWSLAVLCIQDAEATGIIPCPSVQRDFYPGVEPQNSSAPYVLNVTDEDGQPLPDLSYYGGHLRYNGKNPSFKGAVSRNSAKLGNYKMPVKLRET